MRASAAGSATFPCSKFSEIFVTPVCFSRTPNIYLGLVEPRNLKGDKR